MSGAVPRIRHPRLTASAIAGVLLLIAPAIANAHATLVSSDPAPGSVLASSPRQIRLVFNEPIDITLARLTLTGSAGAVSLQAGSDPHDIHALLAPVKVLPRGTYRVAWRVVSADGHVVAGSFLFAVGSAIDTVAVGGLGARDSAALDQAQPIGPSAAGAPLLAALLRGASVGCAMALAGLLLFLVWPRDNASRRGERVARGLAIAAAMLFCAHLFVWLLDVAPDQHLDADWVQRALGTTTGSFELARCAFAILAAWALWLAGSRRLAFGFALLAVISSSLIGHAVVFHPLWAVPIKAIHLLAVSAWLGGVLWLAIPQRDKSAVYVREAERVSAVALVAVTLVLLTGIIETLLFVPSVAAIVVSAYGALIFAKLAGLAALVGFGAYHRRRGIPALRDGSEPLAFQRSVRREVGVMVVVVLLGGWLADVPPPHPGPPSPASHSSFTEPTQ